MKTPRALQKPARPPSRHFRPKDARSLLTEAHIQQTVTESLQRDGWRAFRTEHAIERNERGGFKRRVGEVGMPDYLYIRHDHPNVALALDLFPNMTEAEIRLEAQVLWIEFKKPGEEPTPQQLAWHTAERERGTMVLVVGDLPTWWEDFRAWYAASGLKRR